MQTVVGIINSRADAERAAENLRAIGIVRDRINLLTPEASEKEFEAVPTTETGQPGTGKALGGVAGGALGATGGASLGAAAASLAVPGIGPIIAVGLVAGTALGVMGGAAAGEALEDSVAPGLPRDELFVYEDGLRRGRTIVIALAEDDPKADAAHGILAEVGAESIDAARESWWVGLRDAEAEEYRAQGGDFQPDEPQFRRGFEAALRPRVRGKSYEEAADHLRERDADVCGNEAFRRRYRRGRVYHQALRQGH